VRARPARARTLTLLATGLGSSLAFLDATVVVVALPRMERDLDLGLSGQQWVVLGYGLALSAFLLVGGAVGDRVGLRKAFASGVLLFAAASFLCAVAPTAALLIAGRFGQGVGGALLTTTSLALLRVVWAGESGRAIGLWTSLTAIATVVGPPLGGVLVELASWRWIFLVNLPLSAVVLALAWAGRTDGERTLRQSRLDVVGATLAAVGLAGVTFAIVEARELDLAAVLLTGFVGAGSLVALAVWTLRAPDPVVPPRLLRRPGLAAANVVTFVVYAALGVTFVFLPVYFQFLGLSPTASSVAFVPPSVALILLAPRVGRIADRIGARLPVGLGASAVGVSSLLMLPVASASEVWTMGLAAILVFSLGLAGIVAPITSAALSPAPGDLAGIASGLNQTVARVGGVLSVAVVGTLAGWVYAAAGGVLATPFDPATALDARGPGIDAFRAILLATAALAFAGAALALTLLSGRPGRRSERGEARARPGALVDAEADLRASRPRGAAGPP
jgi:EmrB/QacA subfamily drug resistance transporter